MLNYNLNLLMYSFSNLFAFCLSQLAVNDVNWHIFEELLNSGRSNPNGCPIKSTFYVSHEWTGLLTKKTILTSQLGL